MRLKIIVDAADRILAVAHVPDVLPGQPPALVAMPVPGPRHRELEVVVPVEHRARKPREHWRALEVTAKGVLYRG